MTGLIKKHAIALGIAGAMVAGAAVPSYAQSRHHSYSQTRHHNTAGTVLGIGAGAVIGTAVAGPVGGVLLGGAMATSAYGGYGPIYASVPDRQLAGPQFCRNDPASTTYSKGGLPRQWTTKGRAACRPALPAL
jgi:hypothetical protein